MLAARPNGRKGPRLPHYVKELWGGAELIPNPLGLVEKQHLRIRLAMVYVHLFGVNAIVGVQA